MSHEFQPYIGPRPFEREDAEKGRFFGRDREAREVLSRVIAHSAVLFYSQSGAGKTSLLNAKLIPLLEEKGFEVLKPARVRGLRPQDIKREAIRNLYVFNTIRSWDDNRTDAKSLTATSISDFLKRRERKVNKEGDKSPYVAIFDQFEELFTFYQERWEDREEFFEQIGDALEGDRFMRVVFAMREDYIAGLDPYLSLLPEKLRTRYRLERLKESAALRAMIGPLENTNYSFEKNVAEELVRDLLTVPVDTPAGIVKATGEFVEPVQLQVVCQTLWENCQRSWQGLKPTDRRIITQEHLKSFGDVDLALSAFYDNALKKVIHSTGINEGKLRTWFENVLITPTGTRGTVFRGSEEAGGLPTKVVDELVNQHLIIGEIRGGAKWLELTHDRLIEPIKGSNEKWRLQYSGGEQTRKLLEDKAAKWVGSGRSKAHLLDEGELLEAKRWLESPNATEVGYSFALLALIQSSQAAVDEAARLREEALVREQHRRAEAEREKAEEQQRRAEVERKRVEEQQHRIEEQSKSARRLRWLAAALAMMFLFAVGLAAVAQHQRTLAIRNAQQAEKSARDAKLAQEKAEEQQEIAVIARKTADENLALLQVAQNEIEQESERAAGQAIKARRAARQAQNLWRQEKRLREDLDDQNLVNRYLRILSAAELRAMIYQREGRVEEAITTYENLVNAYATTKLIRFEMRALEELVKLYQQTGNSTEEKRVKDQLQKLPIPIGEVMRTTIQQNGIEAAVSKYYSLRKSNSDQYYFDEDELNDLGYMLLRNKKTKEAIEIFKLNVWSYPSDYNAYDSLGEAYMIAGDVKLAIENYEISLRINPENTNAVEKLKKLRTR